MDKYIGKRLDGRYEIHELLGVGGMAYVYKAYDNIEKRWVAIKILKEELAGNSDFLRRFRNESKAIAVLSHPNIVKVYDVSFGDRIQYIVMEYIDGITLKNSGDWVQTYDQCDRLKINGITVGTLVPLFNVLKPMKDVWDSLTQSSVSFTGPYAMNVLLMRIGRIVIAVGQPSPSSSYATGELKAIEKIPEGYRPASYGSILFASNNGGAVGSWYISSDGSITIRGKADKGYYQTCTGCWLTA